MSDLQRLLLLGTALLGAGCAEPADLAGARQVVRRFEDAVRAGDRTALRQVVTSESRPGVDAMALDASAPPQPLTVLDAVQRPDGVHVRVRDPNHGDRVGALVVVRENGDLRLDLVATAGLSAREVPLPGPRQRSVVRPLSPRERAQAAHAAAAAAAAPTDGRP